MTKYIGPSPSQHDTLVFIWVYLQENFMQPSYRDIGEELDIRTNAVCDRLEALQKKGYIEMTRRSRGVLITDKGRQYLQEKMA